MIKAFSKNEIWEVRLLVVYHIIHGLIPWWKFFEEKVGTPTKDHKPAIGRNTNYWRHLQKNFRCARNHFQSLKKMKRR